MSRFTRELCELAERSLPTGLEGAPAESMRFQLGELRRAAAYLEERRLDTALNPLRSVVDPALQPFAEVLAVVVRLAQTPGPLEDWELVEQEQARWADGDGELEAMRDAEAEGDLYARDDEGEPVEMDDE